MNDKDYDAYFKTNSFLNMANPPLAFGFPLASRPSSSSSGSAASSSTAVPNMPADVAPNDAADQSTDGPAFVPSRDFVVDLCDSQSQEVMQEWVAVQESLEAAQEPDLN
jgi:hypothetical protein